MEVMQQFMAEVEQKKEVMHHFKEEVEEVVEEALLLRRRSANFLASAGGNSTASTGEVAVDLDTSKMEAGGVNVEGEEKEEKSEDIVYFDKWEGNGSKWSHFNVKVEDLGAKLKDADIHQVLSAVINGKEVNNLKDKLLAGSNLPTSTKPQLQGETDQHAEVDDELEESDEEVIELEFERAVEKIHTHDDYNMYCPNCSSRITKVVLRRKIRQKRVRIPSDTQRDDLFGCLSCFSIFVPSGTRLNPFRIFGAGKGPESTPLLQQQQTPDASMPTSGTTTQVKGRGFDPFRIFGKRRPCENDLDSQLLPAADINSSSPKVMNKPRDQATDQGDVAKIIIPNAIPPLGLTQSNGSVASVAAVGNTIQTSTPSKGSGLNGTEIIGFYGKTEVFVKQPESEIKGQDDTLNQLDGDGVKIIIPNAIPPLGITESNGSVASVTAVGNIIQTSTPSQGSALNGNEIIGFYGKTEVFVRQPESEIKGQDDILNQLDGDGVKIIIPNAIPPLGITESNGSVASVAAVGNIIQTSIPSQGSALNGNEIIGFYGKTEVFVRQPESEIKGQDDIHNQLDGGDVRIPIEETPVETRIPEYPPISDDFITDARLPVTITESQGSRSVEIIKSIAYGGLMESITSLSVVSSAAASEATTLNIVALGLANLVGGLVVLAHNLRDLRYGDSSETNENRYKEQLGRKEHFIMHATIAVLSYLVFGLIPPVIYGFTFRGTDDRDYKLLAVAAASLFCIVVLAIAKAYVRGEHKLMAYFKTIVYYVTSAVMVSGIAYAVGDLVNKLLARLGWLNTPTIEPQLFSQAKSFNPTSWASY